MIKIGMMIGDRYEILEKIGTGGMSDVYKAKCHKLNRFVAVKVLKQEFGENENFVSKFRIEAQAAAGLMHPNIVNVYDVGEENGIHYIVMELVEGITLKRYIEKKARLSFKEAVSIAIQVSMGIEAAHNNHIIHRDIKPQNIIISRDGKVKVTDFGIAKAATSNTITSNVMGSVHYTSPEQARGGYSDEKSDIYSLGITMFEMLTGRVPFNGETTVAIAIKHIQEELPMPSQYVPEIPGSVEGIVLKCCQKSPDRRYQNMQEVIADLKQSLLNPDSDFVVMNDPEMEGGTRMITDSDMDQIKRRTVYQENTGRVAVGDSMRLWTESEPEYTEEEDDYDYNPKVEKITTWLAIIGGIVICIIVIVLAIHVFGSDNEGDGDESSSVIVTQQPSSGEEIVYVKMPDVKGWIVEDARNALYQAGLNSTVEYQVSDTIDAGVVINTSVTVNTEVPKGSTVILFASAGQEEIEVPNLSGYTYVRANSELTDLGFVVKKAEGYSNDVAVGYVISQSPDAGTSVPKGTNITVTVSVGKDKIWVPNLLGKTEDQATSEIKASGLKTGSISYVYNSEYEAGTVCYQSYSEGSYVEPGTSMDLKVSKGPELYTYKCNTSIEAPSVTEAPDYVSGSEVTITFVADSGQPLLNTKTTVFPQAANYYGLSAAGGTITMSYTAGNGEVKSFTRRIEFVRE